MEHPSLFFTQTEASELHERILKGNRSQRFLKYAIRLCESYLDSDHSDYFDFVKRESKFWHERNGNFIITHRLLTLGITGWLADRQDFLIIAKDAFVTIIREGVVDNLGKYKTWRKQGAHDAGKYFFLLATIYDWVYYILSEEEKGLIVSHAHECVSFSYKPGEQATNNLENNRGNRFFSGLYMLAHVFKSTAGPEKKRMEDISENPQYLLERFIRQSFGRDGEPYEGASYGPSNMHFFVLVALVFKKGWNDRRLTRIVEYIIQETVYSKGWVNNLNDCNKVLPSQILYYVAIRFKHPVALWLWDKFAMDEHSSMYVLGEGEKVMSDHSTVPWFLLWPDDQSVSPKSPTEMNYPFSRHFRDKGIVSMRTGFHSNDLHVTLASGPVTPRHHQQADQNQMTLYARGEEFLIDHGYTMENSPEHLRAGLFMFKKIASESKYHNLIRIDDIEQSDQRLNNGYGSGQILDFKRSNDYHYALADASEAYPLKTAQRIERHILMSNISSENPYVICIDDVDYDNEEHLYELLLHTAMGNRFEVKEDKVMIHGKVNILDIHFASSSPIKIREGDNYEIPFLSISQKTLRARYVMLMHPRSVDGASAIFNADISDDCIKAEVQLNGRCHTHLFNTKERRDVDVDYLNGYID